jgi:hypothetical protein
VDSLPLVAFEPVQSPDAEHDEALLELQLSVEEPPCRVAVGLALRARVGVGGGVAGVTLTVTLCAAEPPAPLQLSV